MAKPFILISDGFDKELFTEFRNSNDFEVYPESKVSPEKLKELLPKISGLIVRSATTVNKDLVDQAPNLKYVIRAGEGVDNIDVKYCESKGIKVSNTPGANSNSAAEHAIALMMTVLRKTAVAHESMKRGEWEKSKFSGNELAGKTVGFVGIGRIGQIVAKRISGFEPKVLFFDPMIEKLDLAYAKKATLDEVFSQSDIITIHSPLLPTTKNMIGKELLCKMKKSAILINAARGGIVNESDLYDCLKNHTLRGAGLDVFENEPLKKDHQLSTLDNVVLTPHLGASTEEAQVRVGEMALYQMHEFFLKNNLLNQVKA